MSSLLRAARQIMRVSARANLPPQPQLLHASRPASAAVCRAKPAATPIATFAVSPRLVHPRAPSLLFPRSFSTVRETPPPQPFASSAAAIEYAAAAARGLPVPVTAPPLHPHPLPTPRPPSESAVGSSDAVSSEVRRVVVLGTGSSDPLNLLRALKKEAAGPSAATSPAAITAFEELRRPDARINGYAFRSQVSRCTLAFTGGVGVGRSQLQLSYYRSWPFLDFARARVWDRCGDASLAILVIDALSDSVPDTLGASQILSQSPRDWSWIVFIDHAEYAQANKLAEIEEDARVLLNKFGFASGAVIRGSTSVALSSSKSSNAAEGELGSPAMRKLLSAIDIAAQSRSPHETDRGFVAAVRSVELSLSSSRVDPKHHRSIVYTHPRSSPSFFTRHADQLAVGDKCDWISPETGVTWSSEVQAIRSEADGSVEITVAGSHALSEAAPGSDPAFAASAAVAGCYLASSRAAGVDCANTLEADVYMLSRAEGGRFKPFVHQSRAFVRFGSLRAIAASTSSSSASDSSQPLALEGVVQILPPASSDCRSDLHRPPDRALCAGHNLRVRLMLRRDAFVTSDLPFALMDSARGGRVLAVGAVTRPLSRLGPSVSVPLPPFPLRSRLSSWFHSFCGVFYALVGWWLGPLVVGLMFVVEGVQLLFYAAVAGALGYLLLFWLPADEERRRQEQQKAEETAKRKREARWSWLRGGSEAASTPAATTTSPPAATAAAPSFAATPSAPSSSASESSDAETTQALVHWAVGWLKRRADEEEAAATRKAGAPQTDPK